MSDNALPKVNLFYREGSSDKVYTVAIEEADGGYLVNAWNGRRGGTMTLRPQTKAPVSLADAQKVYDKTVAKKMKEGYQPGGDAATYVPATADFEAVRAQCQLLNAIERAELPALLTDPAFFAQEKMDGKRMLVGRNEGAVYALNRSGKGCAFPAAVQAALEGQPWGDFLLDGEMVGETYHVFDVLVVDGASVRERSYEDRVLVLVGLLQTVTSDAVRMVPVARTAAEKAALFEALETRGAEGIVLKRAAATYVPGRPASGGSQLKFKFTETATCRVAAENAQRSVALELLDADGRWTGVGNVTVKANQSVPAVGALVEVKYLYAFPGGSLFQPELLGVRDDLAEDDCTIDQLKFKAEAT